MDADCDSSKKPDICSPSPIDIEISEQIPHANYDPLSTNKEHDIALLRLKEKVTYSEFIKPICLPAKNHQADEKLEVSGWHISEMYANS